MDSRRTGIAILLAGTLATCLPLDVSAKPKASQPDPVDAAQQTEVLALQTRVRELGEMQARLLKQVEEQAQLLEQVKQAAASRSIVAPGSLSAIPPTDAMPLQEEAEDHSRFDWVLGGITAFACILCVILLMRIRQPEAGSALRHYKDADASLDDFPDLDVEAVVPPPVHPMLPALPDWDPASPALDLQAAEVLTQEDKTQTHDSTIELAEIMLSFGRINSAAEALANFIENNPKAAIAPWLKLLEVYRESGQRAEFDKIAHNLNKTFNVRTVDWNNFIELRNPAHGLEEMPHIMLRLQQLWGSRECQAYMQYLLRDNRDETRHGFSLTAIDDIICLNTILEHDLGPYTGPLDAFSSDNTEENAPQTETDKKEDQQAAGETESAYIKKILAEKSGEQAEAEPELKSEPEPESAQEPEPPHESDGKP
ncbi:MAG: hypothetical protein LBI68_10235 [Azoarcus sp.]|jgi:TolA-binding protein|nr:hypothetical protein [Azoarcus sp.]